MWVPPREEHMAQTASWTAKEGGKCFSKDFSRGTCGGGTVVIILAQISCPSFHREKQCFCKRRILDARMTPTALIIPLKRMLGDAGGLVTLYSILVRATPSIHMKGGGNVGRPDAKIRGWRADRQKISLNVSPQLSRRLPVMEASRFSSHKR
jgi:hypothetical protein